MPEEALRPQRAAKAQPETRASPGRRGRAAAPRRAGHGEALGRCARAATVGRSPSSAASWRPLDLSSERRTNVALKEMAANPRDQKWQCYLEKCGQAARRELINDVQGGRWPRCLFSVPTPGGDSSAAPQQLNPREVSVNAEVGVGDRVRVWTTMARRTDDVRVRPEATARERFGARYKAARNYLDPTQIVRNNAAGLPDAQYVVERRQAEEQGLRAEHAVIEIRSNNTSRTLCFCGGSGKGWSIEPGVQSLDHWFNAKLGQAANLARDGAAPEELQPIVLIGMGTLSQQALDRLRSLTRDANLAQVRDFKGPGDCIVRLGFPKGSPMASFAQFVRVPRSGATPTCLNCIAFAHYMFPELINCYGTLGTAGAYLPGRCYSLPQEMTTAWCPPADVECSGISGKRLAAPSSHDDSMARKRMKQTGDISGAFRAATGSSSSSANDYIRDRLQAVHAATVPTSAAGPHPQAG